ncbi:hypothetical protein ACSEN7_25635 [Pseudomonas aeruginosa]
MSIDWSKAPDGCIGAFARIVGNQRKAFFVFSKRPSGYMSREGYEGEGEDGSYHVFSEFWEWLDKPWNGKGLPPVGISVEWLSSAHGWLGGRVVGHDGSVAVVSHNDGYTGCHPHEVRPMPPPEQIAAEEREKAIEEMCFAVETLTVKQAKALFDAGYRRQESST